MSDYPTGTGWLLGGWLVSVSLGEGERKIEEQNCDLDSCRFATLAMLAGNIGDCFGQGSTP